MDTHAVSKTMISNSIEGQEHLDTQISTWTPINEPYMRIVDKTYPWNGCGASFEAELVSEARCQERVFDARLPKIHEYDEKRN